MCDESVGNTSSMPDWALEEGVEHVLMEFRTCGGQMTVNEGVYGEERVWWLERGCGKGCGEVGGVVLVLLPPSRYSGWHMDMGVTLSRHERPDSKPDPKACWKRVVEEGGDVSVLGLESGVMCSASGEK